MNFLTPLGFLGLIGIAVLILIYVIKPNYQNKIISSTYLWRLSLKYRKNAVPISKINRILLFISQLLILTICALLLARPAISEENNGDSREKIIIIESSGSMQLKGKSDTRYERALERAEALAKDTLKDGGTVSVVIADDEPRFIINRCTAEGEEELISAFRTAKDEDADYGRADIEGAFALAEEVLAYNNEAKVYLYTATSYIDKGDVTVEDVSESEEWNAAILSCEAKYNRNNHYEIRVDVGCFGKTEMIDIVCEIHKPNGKSETAIASKQQFFDPGEDTKTVIFTTDDFGGTPILDFDYIEIYVPTDDSLGDDNSFLLYGGTKETIRIQYASSLPNIFFGTALPNLRDAMKDRFDIELVMKDADEVGEVSGFDLYVFEHTMPDVIPTDGVVLLVDPDKAPESSGLIIGDAHRVNSDSTLASGVAHELMNLVDPSRITIAKYNEIVAADGYRELAYYKGNPVLLAKEEGDTKIVVWAFDLNNSNIIAMPDFSFLIYNLFGYFIPSTLESHYFEVGDTVNITARGDEVTVSGAGTTEPIDNGVGSITVKAPGTYTVTQTLLRANKQSRENFFVKIPESESDITKQIDALPYIEVEKNEGTAHRDLLIYFAIALLALMAAEWYLFNRKKN